MLQHGTGLGLEKAGFTPTKVETEAACTSTSRARDSRSPAWPDARATVPGIDDAKFQSIAAATKEGCPVSGALKDNVQIDLTATLNS